jgi:hypothetical protein
MEVSSIEDTICQVSVYVKYIVAKVLAKMTSLIKIVRYDTDACLPPAVEFAFPEFSKQIKGLDGRIGQFEG